MNINLCACQMSSIVKSLVIYKGQLLFTQKQLEFQLRLCWVELSLLLSHQVNYNFNPYS